MFQGVELATSSNSGLGFWSGCSVLSSDGSVNERINRGPRRLRLAPSSIAPVVVGGSVVLDGRSPLRIVYSPSSAGRVFRADRGFILSRGGNCGRPTKCAE